MSWRLNFRALFRDEEFRDEELRDEKFKEAT
jgi:hypothetical protein